MKVESENLYENELKHRFLGYYRREVDGQPVFIYRCICGYIEAVPVAGGHIRRWTTIFALARTLAASSSILIWSVRTS